MKKLDRDLGLVSIIAIAIGSMIGGGIFILPGLAAKYTGASLWLAYLISGCLIIPAALSQSEMATAMPKAGGVYVFVDRSMGPMFGTIAGIGTWLAMMLKASFALVGIGTYLSVFSSLPIIPVALVLLCGIAVLNIFGVKKVGKAQIVVVVLLWSRALFQLGRAGLRYFTLALLVLLAPSLVSELLRALLQSVDVLLRE